MKNYFFAFALAILVVLTGFSLKQSVAGFGGISPVATAIGGAPMPVPQNGAAIGGAPMPVPQNGAAIGGAPMPVPQNGAAIEGTR